MDKAFIAARESIGILHHPSWVMDYSKVIAKQLLSPAMDDMDFAVVI